GRGGVLRGIRRELARLHPAGLGGPLRAGDGAPERGAARRAPRAAGERDRDSLPDAGLERPERRAGGGESAVGRSRKGRATGQSLTRGPGAVTRERGLYCPIGRPGGASSFRARGL